MSELDYWRVLISQSLPHHATPLPAVEFLASYQSQTMPAGLLCGTRGEEREFVVKGMSRFAGYESLYCEQIVAHLGRRLGAPIPPVKLIDVSYNLIRTTFSLAHFLEGIGHGSLLIRNVFDSDEILHWKDHARNRAAFTALAILSGWVRTNQDFQPEFLYDQSHPHFVYSVDHGDWLGHSAHWNQFDESEAAFPVIDPYFRFHLSLRAEEMQLVARRLRQISDLSLARIVAMPPETWDIPLDRRAALACFLSRRRDQIIAAMKA